MRGFWCFALLCVASTACTLLVVTTDLSGEGAGVPSDAQVEADTMVDAPRPVSCALKANVLAHKLLSLTTDFVITAGEAIEKMPAVATADEHAMNDLEVRNRGRIYVEDCDRLRPRAGIVAGSGVTPALESTGAEKYHSAPARGA
jgi:hypothetical protein